MQDKSKKPKTIQMKYPAQYSQSWTEDKPKATVNTKKKSNDSGQIVYPLPFTKTDLHSERKVPKIRKNTTSHTASQLVYSIPFTKTVPHSERKVAKIRKNATSRRQSQKVNRAMETQHNSWLPAKVSKVSRAPDPTAAHLKYGVFQPPKIKPVATKPPTQPPPVPRKLPRTFSTERVNKKKAKLPKGVLGDQGDSSTSAVQVTRQLTISTPTHLDIKPRDGWRRLN